MRERAAGRLGDAHGVVDGGVAAFSLVLDMARQVLRTCHHGCVPVLDPRRQKCLTYAHNRYVMVESPHTHFLTRLLCTS